MMKICRIDRMVFYSGLIVLFISLLESTYALDYLLLPYAAFYLFGYPFVFMRCYKKPRLVYVVLTSFFFSGVYASVFLTVRNLPGKEAMALFISSGLILLAILSRLRKDFLPDRKTRENFLLHYFLLFMFLGSAFWL